MSIFYQYYCDVLVDDGNMLRRIWEFADFEASAIWLPISHPFKRNNLLAVYFTRSIYERKRNIFFTYIYIFYYISFQYTTILCYCASCTFVKQRINA